MSWEPPTCWEDCALCGEELYHQPDADLKRRIFALCNLPGRIGRKRYEFDIACEHAQAPSAKQVGTGWEDY